MAGAANKKCVVAEQRARTEYNGSSSGDTSSSGKATHSERSSASASRSHHVSSSRALTARSSRPAQMDGNADPAPLNERNPATSKVIIDDKRLNFDLGMSGWSTIRGLEISKGMPPRQAPSKLGVAIKVGLNSFHVETFPDIPIYQYDVQIGSGVEKRGAIRAVWESKAVQKEVGANSVFDGNKLMWSGKSFDRPEIRFLVDLNAEEGRDMTKVKGRYHITCRCHITCHDLTNTPTDPDKQRFYVQIRKTNRVRFDTLKAHLQGKASFDNACLEAINFADHLLRSTPSTKFTPIKRAFFQTRIDGKATNNASMSLGAGVEAFKGVYQSLRLVHPGRLAINIDVANGVFWINQKLMDTAVQLTGCRDPSDLSAALSRGGESSRQGKALKRLRKIHVLTKHRNGQADRICIDRFIYKSAKQHKFKILNSGVEVETTLYNYYANKYNIRLQYPDLPLVQSTKALRSKDPKDPTSKVLTSLYPMEILMIKENQRFNYKMDEKQTANMIKFAVTAPPERWSHIEHGQKMLSWNSDPMLQKYGLTVANKRTNVDARLLTAPTVKYAKGEAKPGTSGRWDLKAKVLLQSNPVPLKSWAICVISGRRGGKPDKATIDKFVSEFVKGYIGLGGKVENRNPPMVLASGEDAGAWVTDTWNKAGNSAQSRPQMLMFILPDKDSTTYGRIKRSCECRYGVVSQCVQYAHAQKAQLQYIANVCMKFNAKLGGATCRAVGKTTAAPNGIFTSPTMIIGADVSHTAPGVEAPSMAALTMSLDKLATRYAAACQANGYRVEIINTDIINAELKSLVMHWVSSVGNGKLPAVVFYLRDGVSEGQYSHVLAQEVSDMKAMFKTIDPGNTTKFVVIVGSKRHHVRFFPDKGDKNGNPLPGTLVESGVTNPFENDFFLCGHNALKGTARPVHYYVLMNETALGNDYIHTLLYEHAYQYARATTPVSIHPAIYYAHLAAARAVPHDPKWSGATDAAAAGTTNKQSGSQGQSGGSSSGVPTDCEKLLDMPNQGGIRSSMWYI